MSTFSSLASRIIVITGPTASGKTELAIRVAQQLRKAPQPIGIEIISLDSIAVYQGMDVGTAKPSLQDQQQVAHHLLDVAKPNEEFSVAEYLQRAHRCVDEIESRGNRAMFVGGTPLYLRAVLRGFDPGPPPDEDFRMQVEQDVQRYGVEALRERLWQVDPLSTTRIEKSDVRRMIRALEFVRHTGVPISHRQTHLENPPTQDETLVFRLQVPRRVLHDRIELRVQRMFANGLIAEVRGLLQQYGTFSKTASQGVGYREVIQAIQTDGALDDAKQQVLYHTRRLARRQETWFRSFSELRPLATHEPSRKDPDPTDPTAWQPRDGQAMVDEIVATINKNL